MLQTINLSSDPWTLASFADAAALRAFYQSCGCDGVELILCGEDFQGKLEPGMVHGLHLVFYPEWIALWQEDYAYLDREFGSRDAWASFYGLDSGTQLLAHYRQELEIAHALGARYVVFHMGDNPLDEYFTLRFRRSPEDQLSASVAFLNALFADTAFRGDLLLENMWLGCMNLTDPSLTCRALEEIHYPHTGLMLDTGHLMSTNPALENPDQACRYIHQVLDNHAAISDRFWGVHLHASLSGAALSALPLPPPSRDISYLERYGLANDHLRKIDRHRPFVVDGLRPLVERIQPKYLCHELRHDGNLDRWRGDVLSQSDRLSTL